MKYNPDSYLLYDAGGFITYNFCIRIELKKEIDGAVLDRAAQRAIRRYPYFAVRVVLDEQGGYVLEENHRPIAVNPTAKKRPDLGTAQVNGHLCSIDYEGRTISFNISHSITAAPAAMRWVKTTLYEYLCEKEKVQLPAEFIQLSDSPVQEAETAFPEIGQIPDEQPIGTADKGGGYFPIGDYIKAMLSPKKNDGYFYRLCFQQDDLMEYARSNDGSPNAVISILEFKALAKVFPAKAKKISVAIACNSAADFGMPDSHSDYTRQLHVTYDRGMAKWSAGKLGTMTRGRMMLQQEAAYSYRFMRNTIADNEKTDQMQGLKAKKKYAKKHNRYVAEGLDTFNVSYVGQTKWGSLEPYMDSVYTLADGHLMSEINALGDRIFVTFHQVTKNTKYIDALKQVIAEEKIPCQITGPFLKNMPNTRLEV